MQSSRALIAAASPCSPTIIAIAWASIALAITCAMVICGDIALGRRQQMGVMNVVWPLTALYGGPLALLAYYAFGRAKLPMPHNADAAQHRATHSHRPMWQSTLLGATHCGAGCMLGDVISDTTLFLVGATALLGSALITSYVFDFVAAYLLGIVFQYFAIVPMRHLSPAQGIWAAIKADTLSLVAFQVGMYAWTAVSQKLIFHASPEADSPVFWFMMQIAMIAGLATSFPMNWLLIRNGIKEKM